MSRAAVSRSHPSAKTGERLRLSSYGAHTSPTQAKPGLEWATHQRFRPIAGGSGVSWRESFWRGEEACYRVEEISRWNGLRQNLEVVALAPSGFQKVGHAAIAG